MKRYIRSTTEENILKIEVVFNVDISTITDENIAAATYKGHEIPEGELPPADKKAVMNSQVYRDYKAFIKAVEEIVSDYDLFIYYKNQSKYNSFYWSGLAKDADGEPLIDYTMRLRVSTHDAERTKQSQKRKKDEKKELMKISKGKRVTPMPIDAVINNKSTQFDSYLDAIAWIDEHIEHAVEVMTRRKGRQKK